jgi:adenine-specific DNA-methyltransferase
MQLNKAYSKDDFKDFLTGFLPDDLNLSEKELVIGSNYKNIKSGLVLGESESLGVKFFYLEHEKEKDPRVALTTEAFKILSDNWAKKALVVFNSKNSENWRLSLMTISFDINEKNKIVSNLSNPKRKSFFLGPNAKIATANQFLCNKGTVKDFEDLKSRFDVEVVTKEFFNNYKKLYEKLFDYLKNDKAFNVFSAKHGLELEIFGKKLLGQIVFIYFLQKKGWLGAKKGDNISNGDKIFLRSLFEKCKQQGKNFFNDYLENLFYDCLNRIPERAGIFYREKFDCQIPFLNGGLFEPVNDYKWQSEFINIPNEIFSNSENSGILDVFDLYNFTIDENTPDDQEISVDPEMLGKVFENLLESNIRKGQGAFYTPREIVHYMCRESLVNYLATNHSNLSEENIRSYINYGDGLNKSIEELGKNWKGESFTPGQFNELNELLRNIKVVDPACGSGAFLVGMLQEIVRLRTFLQLTPDSELFSNSSNSIKELSIYDLKKETIQNCLYGVDIDPGAIDIAKLRFWLSIVVEENIEDIEPLPNLDYKIMQGNSLLEDLVIGDSVIPLKFERKKKIDGRTKEKKDLFNESHQAKLFIDESEALVEKLGKYHAEYFYVTDPDKKKILKKKIDGVEDELIQSKCNEEIERADSFIKNNPNDSKKILKYNEKILAIKDVLRKWKIDHLRPFFPWKLHFGEVFIRENSGFDVVVGNPPYGVSLKGQHRVVITKSLGKVPDYEIFYYFVELAKKLLSKSGINSYIIPNTFLFNVFAAEYRKNILDYWHINILIDCTAFKLFESATVRNAITVFSKSVNPEMIGYKNTLAAENFEDLLNRKTLFISKNNLLLNNVNWGLTFKLLPETLSVISKIKLSKRRVSDIFPEISQGLIAYDKHTGQDEEIIKNRSFHYLEKINESVKKWLWGEDVTPYIVEWNGKEFINYGSGIANPRLPKYFKGKRILIREITNPRIYAAFTDCELYHDPAIIVVLDNNENISLLLGILNSKLATFYHFNASPKATKGAFPKILVKDIKEFPFPDIITSEQKNIGNQIELLVEKVLVEKKSNPKKNTKNLEAQIDQLVYKLYGLTPEEIEIVENSSKK